MDHQSQALGLFSTPKYLLCDPATGTYPHGTERRLAPVTDNGGGGGWPHRSGCPGGGPALVPPHGTQQHFWVTRESDGHMTVPLTLLSPFFIPVTCNSSPQFLGTWLGSLASRSYFQAFSCRDHEAYFALGPSADPPQLPGVHRNSRKGLMLLMAATICA